MSDVKIIRVQNGDFVKLLKEVPIPELEIPREIFLATLKERLNKQDPDLLVVGLFYPDRDRYALGGYVVVTKTADSGHVYVYCAWDDPKIVTINDRQRMLRMTAGWAIADNKPNIRYDTSKVPHRFADVFGAWTYSEIKVLDLGVDNGLFREYAGGIERRVGESDEPGTKSDSTAAGTDTAAGVESGSDGVYGGESGPDDRGDEHSEGTVGDVRSLRADG